MLFLPHEQAGSGLKVWAVFFLCVLYIKRIDAYNYRSYRHIERIWMPRICCEAGMARTSAWCYLRPFLFSTSFLWVSTTRTLFLVMATHPPGCFGSRFLAWWGWAQYSGLRKNARVRPLTSHLGHIFLVTAPPQRPCKQALFPLLGTFGIGNPMEAIETPRKRLPHTSFSCHAPLHHAPLRVPRGPRGAVVRPERGRPSAAALFQASHFKAIRCVAAGPSGSRGSAAGRSW